MSDNRILNPGTWPDEPVEIDAKRIRFEIEGGYVDISHSDHGGIEVRGVGKLITSGLSVSPESGNVVSIQLREARR